jgi:nucleotide-binding universal stress UspA family protein
MDDNTGTILVGYDGSPDADLAIEWAAQTALLEGVRVQVAIVEDIGALPGVAWWPEDYWTDVAEHAQQVLTKAGIEESTIIRRRGALVPTLTALAHDAAILVMGSRGHSRASEFFVGSVSQHLARHAPSPVVAVRPTEGPADRIVVGLDGSPGSAEALDFACRRARLTGERVSAVRAAKTDPVHLDGKGRLSDALGAFLTGQEHQLSISVAKAAAENPDIDIEPEFIALPPADALVETSRHASLLVVGSRGLNAFSGLLLGSVSHEVLHRAHCPVAVVR